MKNSYRSILSRYAILLFLAIFGLSFFYFLFTPLTIHPIYFLFKLFFKEVSLTGITILIYQIYPIEIVGACVGGSAYYLLTILSLSTPEIKIKKRIKALIISYFAFLIINLIRIFVLGIMFVEGSSALDVAHKAFWYLGSTLFVISIWFAEVKYFKIKEIPFYSDIKFLIRNIYSRK